MSQKASIHDMLRYENFLNFVPQAHVSQFISNMMISHEKKWQVKNKKIKSVLIKIQKKNMIQIFETKSICEMHSQIFEFPNIV